MEEKEIIDLILKGDKDKFRQIVEQNQEMIFRTCMGYVHNKEDADDLTQEVFIQAYQALSGFRHQSSISTWLYRIAINTSLNKIRKNFRNFTFYRLNEIFRSGKNEIPFIDLAHDENPENILILEEHRTLVRKALDRLPENQRTAIVLSKYDDLSQKEIAEIMKTTEGAVEALIQRAKTNLRKNMASYSGKNSK